jgi:hypothetical protein
MTESTSSSEEGYIFRSSSSIYRDLDAAALILDSTVEEALKEEPNNRELNDISRCASLALEEEDDDLNDEWQNLEASELALRDELNASVSELNLSMISIASPEITIFTIDFDEEENEYSPMTRSNQIEETGGVNMTMDTVGLLAESERIIGLAQATTPSSSRKVRALEELNTHLSAISFEEEEIGIDFLGERGHIVSLENTAKKGKSRQMKERKVSFVPDLVVEEEKEEATPAELPETATVLRTGSLKSRDAGNKKRFGRGKDNGRLKAYLPKLRMFSFGAKEKRRKQEDPQINEYDPPSSPAMETVQEETLYQGHTQSLPTAPPRDKNPMERLSMDHAMKKEHDIEEDPVNPERVVIRKLLRMLESTSRKNTKLQQHQKQLLKMMTDAWHDKIRTEELHRMQSTHITETLQKKMNDASRKCRELANENRVLRTLMSQDSTTAVHAEFERKMRVKYQEQLEQEVQSRLAEHGENDMRLRQELETTKEKCAIMMSDASHDKIRTQELHQMQSIHIAETVQLAETVQQKMNDTSRKYRELANENRVLRTREKLIEGLYAAQKEAQDAMTSVPPMDYFDLLNQARTEVQTEIQALKDSHAKEIQYLQTPIGGGVPKTSGKGLRQREAKGKAKNSNNPSKEIGKFPGHSHNPSLKIDVENNIMGLVSKIPSQRDTAPTMNATEVELQFPSFLKHSRETAFNTENIVAFPTKIPTPQNRLPKLFLR